ncbi:DNA repair protein RAD51 homolog 4-like [Leptopilina heterotoma]|uniref:DNA repair protein RAD51 homolog 4-like n=1 Tax=Leptopilina heterotoma TaxID=63436 RepID=UPI001CA8266D|nr:DNA repair protein RAD51 homolog 4-like [Leptopilina heterotoma]
MSRLNSSTHENLTDSIIKNLFSKGIFTDFDFINKDTKLLSKITGFSFKRIVEIKNEFSEFRGGCTTIVGADYYENETVFTSGILNLDKLLGGGFYSNQIYEFCGASSAGKTQLCLSIATNIALEKNYVVHYIDTKGDYSVTRVVQILNAKNCSDEDIVRVLMNIKVTKITNSKGIFSILNYLGNITKEEFKTKLLIIDSLSTFCLTSTAKTETMYSLIHLKNMIRFITNEFNIPVITTNLVTQWTEENPLKNGVNVTIFKPTLGKFWYTVPNTRILLKYLKDEEREISIWQSVDFKIGTFCNLNITSTGFS